jgi:hypothetical protein
MGETVPFFSTQTSRTVAIEGERSHSGKKYKDKMTLK